MSALPLSLVSVGGLESSSYKARREGLVGVERAHIVVLLRWQVREDSVRVRCVGLLRGKHAVIGLEGAFVRLEAVADDAAAHADSLLLPGQSAAQLLVGPLQTTAHPLAHPIGIGVAVGPGYATALLVVGVGRVLPVVDALLRENVRGEDLAVLVWVQEALR